MNFQHSGPQFAPSLMISQAVSDISRAFCPELPCPNALDYLREIMKMVATPTPPATTELVSDTPDFSWALQKTLKTMRIRYKEMNQICSSLFRSHCLTAAIFSVGRRNVTVCSFLQPRLYRRVQHQLQRNVQKPVTVPHLWGDILHTHTCSSTCSVSSSP